MCATMIAESSKTILHHLTVYLVLEGTESKDVDLCLTSQLISIPQYGCSLLLMCLMHHFILLYWKLSKTSVQYKITGYLLFFKSSATPPVSFSAFPCATG